MGVVHRWCAEIEDARSGCAHQNTADSSEPHNEAKSNDHTKRVKCWDDGQQTDGRNDIAMQVQGARQNACRPKRQSRLLLEIQSRFTSLKLFNQWRSLPLRAYHLQQRHQR